MPGLGQLPTITPAPIDEILDLRSDLSGALSRYRSVMIALEEQFKLGPFDEHRQAEVIAVWRQHVEPALVALREEMADHSLVREVLRYVTTDIKVLMAGAIATGT
jgi:hypothetical protein